jgi:hypothetical protein
MWVLVGTASVVGALQPHGDRGALAVVLPGIIIVCTIGCVLLRRNLYFVSDKTFGFRERNKIYVIPFDDVESVTIHYGRKAYIIYKGVTLTVRIDPTMNQSWWDAVRERLKPSLGPNWMTLDQRGQVVGGE